jgi:tetratricopeptide (TPR) repeat protein
MKANKFLRYFLTACSFLVILLGHAQNWQQHLEEGKSLYKAGDYSGAYQSFQKAQALAPEPSQLDAYLAQTAYRAGKFDEAVSAYQRARNNNTDTWSSYNHGNAQFRNNDIKGAIESYKEALRKNPNNDMARYNLSYAMKKQQEQENKDNKQEEPQDPKEQDQNQDKQNQDKQNQPDQQPANQAKLGREQTEQLLESMNQADKKAQDKLKDKENKAVGDGKLEKDW